MLRLQKTLLLLTAAAGLAAAASAQPTRVLTPDEAVRLGLAHDAHVQAARAEADEAAALYRQARAARLPSVQALASYTRLSDNIPEIAFSTDFFPGLADTTFTLAPVELNRYHAEVSVEQPLFTGFRLHNEIRAARLQAEAAARQAAQEESDAAYRVREAYWRLFQAEAARDAADGAVDAVDAHLRDVENRRAAGAALASDVLAARTRRSEVELERIEAENAVRLAQLELNRLAGLPPGTDVRPAPDSLALAAAAAAPPADLDALVARALEARPGLDALAGQVAALEARLDATRGSWLPELALTGRYVYARPNQYFFTEQDAFKGTWEAGAVLRWDLFDGGRRPAKTAEARARLDAAEARLADARASVAVAVTRQYLEARRAAEAVAVTERHVAEAEEAFRVVRLQYTEGAALASDVLDAEQAYRTARTRRAQALADHALAHAALLNALGVVW